ncbi:MAG TPA: AMP-binding protein [Myxococcaceae bacterium]|jgi:fatty-acyl-CoA synthase
MFLGDFIRRAAESWPDREAVVDVSRGARGRFTFRHLDVRASALAGWLRGQGVGWGDRVGLLCHNGVEYLDALFACAKVGAIFVPYSWRLHARELAELVQKTSPKVLIHGPEHAGTAVALAQGAHGLALLRAEEVDGMSTPPSPPSPPEGMNEEDTLCLLFTGGTTGLPRGARISYRMVGWNALNVLVHEARAGDCTITHTPMFHTGGLLVYTLPLLICGGRVVIMRRWSASEMLELVARERPDFFFAVPTQFQQLLDDAALGTTDFSSVRFVTSGGAPLPVPLLRAFRAVQPLPFKQGFGMTEFGPGLFSMGPEMAEAKAGSIGRPNAFVEARLVREDGQLAATGEVGELQLRGPCGFSGYYGEPSQKGVDAQGWFHTGDLARRDRDGFYFIAGRRKDMFISGGENVFPLEVEQALQAHPAVQQAAVIGVPDSAWGEAGCAYVVLQHGAAATEAELLSHVRERLARFKVPRAIRFIPELPLSAAGKVLKAELHERERAMEAVQVPVPGTEVRTRA